jgi:hypothetical protein
VVRAFIYLEGGATGANSKYLDISCERAFHKLLDGMGFTGRKPRLVACGGRGDVFNRFKTALRNRGGNFIAMWIDSEDPMINTENAWDHLAVVTTVTAWERPDGVTDDQVLFMTTCMETWIVADRAVLREHYGHRLQENQLPPLEDIERRNRHEVQEKLERATKECKNAYAKGKRSFEVLAKLSPAVLKEHLPSYLRIDRILKENL